MIEAMARFVIRWKERLSSSDERALLQQRVAELEAELARRSSTPRALPPRARAEMRRIPEHLLRRAEEARKRASDG